MDKKKRSYLRIIGCGCTFVFLFLIVWIGIVWLNRPAYIEPDTSTFETGDVFFSVGDSWESVAVRTLSGSLSLEVADSTPSHCGIVVRYAEGVKLAHASTVKKKIVLETPEEYLRNNGSYCIYTRKAPCMVDTLAIRQSVETLVKNKVHSISISTTPHRKHCIARRWWSGFLNKTTASVFPNYDIIAICIRTTC